MPQRLSPDAGGKGRSGNRAHGTVLRKDDQQMIDLERDYIDLLISHQAGLKHRWGLL